MKTFEKYISIIIIIVNSMFFSVIMTARASVISNTISTTIKVNRYLSDPTLTGMMVNLVDLYDVTEHYTNVPISNYSAQLDLRESTLNSIRYVKFSASTSCGLKLTLPEFGEINMGTVNKTPTLKDLSLVSSFDDEKDGMKVITMERLGALDNDGDDTKLTISGKLDDLANKGDTKIVVLLPKVAAAWGNNSYILNASYNTNNSGRLVIKDAPKGQEVVLKALARSNQHVDSVRFVVAEVLYTGEHILKTTEAMHIDKGADVNISIPMTLDLGGTYELRIYAEVLN